MALPSLPVAIRQVSDARHLFATGELVNDWSIRGEENGRDAGIRTRDPLTPSQVR